MLGRKSWNGIRSACGFFSARWTSSSRPRLWCNSIRDGASSRDFLPAFSSRRSVGPLRPRLVYITVSVRAKSKTRFPSSRQASGQLSLLDHPPKPAPGSAPVSSLVVGPLPEAARAAVRTILVDRPTVLGNLLCSLFDLSQQAPAADIADSKLLAGLASLLIKEWSAMDLSFEAPPKLRLVFPRQLTGPRPASRVKMRVGSKMVGQVCCLLQLERMGSAADVHTFSGSRAGSTTGKLKPHHRLHLSPEPVEDISLPHRRYSTRCDCLVT